jgi:uncharacterized protein (TIGR02284 family)
MENKKAIDALNTLVEINNDRIEVYETAGRETNEPDLKVLFTKLAETSQDCRIELEREVELLGGTPAKGTKVSGKFFRAWMDVKAAITGKDRKAILESCEYGEDHALKTYESILEDERGDLSSEQISLIESQYDLLKADHDAVRALRDSLVES